MGIFDRFTGILKRNEFCRDFDLNDNLMRMYGEETTMDAFLEIKKESKGKFKETLDINDQILEKYKEKTGDDIQKELMKKYLKASQNEINNELALDEAQENNQIDEELKDKNLSDNEKEKVKKEIKEDTKEVSSEGKSKKEILKNRIYESTYNVMYKDYAHKVENIKNRQFNDRDLSIGTKEAVEIIAMEKNLEKVDLLYYNHCGKNITQVEKIKNNKENFEHKMNYNERGIQNIALEQVRSLDILYKIRAEKYEKYISALKDPTKSQSEKAMYKQEYQEANMKLIQNVPSLSEYTKDLEVKEKNQQLVKEKNIKGTSVVKGYMYVNENEIKQQPDVKETLTNVQKEKLQRDDIGYNRSISEQNEALDKRKIGVAKDISEAQRESNFYDKNIDEVNKSKNKYSIKEENEKQERFSDKNFANSLRKVKKLEDSTKDELLDIIEDRRKDAIEKVKENEAEQAKNQNEYQREIKKKNKFN